MWRWSSGDLTAQRQSTGRKNEIYPDGAHSPQQTTMTFIHWTRRIWPLCPFWFSVAHCWTLGQTQQLYSSILELVCGSIRAKIGTDRTSLHTGIEHSCHQNTNKNEKRLAYHSRLSCLPLYNFLKRLVQLFLKNNVTSCWPEKYKKCCTNIKGRFRQFAKI